MKKLLYILLIICSPLLADNYYVAYNGDNGADGSKETPWATLEYGAKQLSAGDTLFMRGGVWEMDVQTTIETGSVNDGTVGNPIVVINYPGETPILDLTDATEQDDAIVLDEINYWTFKGITVRDAEQDGDTNEVNGWYVQRCNQVHIIECIAYHIEGVGFIAYASDTVYFTNCDAYENFDPDSPSPGNGADGFQALNPADPGWQMVYFSGCRSWYNSDDGFGTMGRTRAEFDSCWTFINGYAWTGGDGEAGRGLNVGQNHVAYPDTLQYVISNCLSAYNKTYGFHINSNATAYMARVNYYNNSSYANGVFGFKGNFGDAVDYYAVFYNNTAYPYTYKISDTEAQFAMENNLNYISEYNSWDAVMSITMSEADFVIFPDSATAVEALGGVRGSDGSLPDLGDLFAIARESDLIDAGVDVGIAYNGDAPDLGAFEFESPGEPSAAGYIVTGGIGNTKLIGGDGKFVSSAIE